MTEFIEHIEFYFTNSFSAYQIIITSGSKGLPHFTLCFYLLLEFVVINMFCNEKENF